MRNIASDTSTLLGGLCCRPSAVRSNDSTTTMRTKLVIMIRIDGAIDSTVIRATICTMRSVNKPAAADVDGKAGIRCGAALALAATGASGAAEAKLGAISASNNTSNGRKNLMRFMWRQTCWWE